MALNKLERDILKLVDNKIIDIEKVEELFKLGANPNALEDDNYYVGRYNEIDYSTFFSECLFESMEKNPDLYPLLELFIKYGLDVNKYGSSILGVLHFIWRNNDVYEMAKLILDNMDKNTNVILGLSSIGTEESYLNCSFDDMDYRSNELYGLCELIEAFSNNKPYKSFYKLPKMINGKFKKISINGDFVLIENKKIVAKYGKDLNNMVSKIEMNNHTLIVKGNHSVYINDEDQNEYEENLFTEYANEYFKNETVINLSLKHYEIRLEKNIISGRLVTINFTNKKRLVYKEDYDNQLEIIEIV